MTILQEFLFCRFLLDTDVLLLDVKKQVKNIWLIIFLYGAAITYNVSKRPLIKSPRAIRPTPYLLFTNLCRSCGFPRRKSQNNKKFAVVKHIEISYAFISRFSNFVMCMLACK
jgi:hypothetical protein